MKRLAFPALFTFVLLGLWVFSRAQGGAAPSSTTPPPSSSTGKKSSKATTPKPDELTDKEEMFAATLSPKNQEIFTKWMTKKQRTMAMEMVIENHRSGGGLTPDQIVDQLSSDFNLEAPQKQSAPAATNPPPPKSTPPSTLPANPAPTNPVPASPPQGSPAPANPAGANPAVPMPEASTSPPKKTDY